MEACMEADIDLLQYINATQFYKGLCMLRPNGQYSTRRTTELRILLQSNLDK